MDDASADLEARVAAAPSDPDLRLRLASAFLRQGMLDEAEAELDAAGPGIPSGRNGLDWAERSR